jgi:hypothetical protein
VTFKYLAILLRPCGYIGHTYPIALAFESVHSDIEMYYSKSGVDVDHVYPVELEKNPTEIERGDQL